MKLRLQHLALYALVAFIAYSAIGCASYPFARGVREYAPDVVKEYTAYVNADASLTTDEKAQRLADADALQTAQADRPIVWSTVRDAWQRVRDSYAAYVDADIDLELPEKSLRAGNVSRMDRLVEVEGGRFIYGGQ